MDTSSATIETKRLVLRHWEDADAASLYEYAKDPAVGPTAGWPAHKSIDESLEIIRTVFSAPETYAVCFKDSGEVIGAIGLKFGDDADLADADDEAELGYWIGKPFWGQGIIPEAVRGILAHAFEDLGLARVWAGYYEGNEQSRRVLEKCGFRYRWTTKDVEVALMGERRTGHVSCITREEWVYYRCRQAEDVAPATANNSRIFPRNENELEEMLDLSASTPLSECATMGEGMIDIKARMGW